MQGRNRYNNDGRGYNSNPNYRSFNRNNSGSFNRKPYAPPPPRRKEEILMHAGRLAAEYLVSKGLLPPEALTPKWQNGKFQDFKGQDRESPVPDGRTSALNRLGNPNSDVGNGRRRYNDEYNEGGMGSRDNFRGKKRLGPSNSRDYGDWGRDSNGRWVGRNRAYNDIEDEDNHGRGYYRDRSGFDQFPSRSENTGESHSENHDVAEDTGSKASSSSTRREADGESSKPMVDDAKAMDLEAGDEGKSDVSGDSKKSRPYEIEEGESKCGVDLMQLSSGFAKVPTKPRSSSGAQKSPKIDEEANNEPSNTNEVSSREPEVTLVEAADRIETNIQEPRVEDSNQEKEPSDCPPGFASSEPIVDQAEETDKREGMKRERDPSPDDEPSRMHNVRAKPSSPEVEWPQVDEEKVAPAVNDQENPLSDDFIPKVEPELDNKMEEEKQFLPSSSSFKICDLNLMHGPEITEIPDDDPDPEEIHPSDSRLETGKELAMDFGLSIGNNSSGADAYDTLSGDDKVIQVIDLEDDSGSDPLKPKDEPIYPNLDSFLNQPEHVDLHEIQDNYSLEISDFLGADISRCPSVPNDLQNLQNLHDAEGVPHDDDSIYVSLGEIPIGFMEVWDQQPPEYGKFF